MPKTTIHIFLQASSLMKSNHIIDAERMIADYVEEWLSRRSAWHDVNDRVNYANTGIN